MSIGQDNDGNINYNFLVFPSFLNSWMNKLTNEGKGKDPGTIRKTVKEFIGLGVAKKSGLFKTKIFKKFQFYYISGATH